MDFPDIVSSPPTRTDRVRAIALMAKKAGMSDEAFFKHWQEVHGPLFANLDIVRKNILKYEQHHYTAVFEDGASSVGFDAKPYHGVAVFEAASLENILEVFKSEEYKPVFLDEFNFLDRSRTMFLPGSVTTFIDG